MGARGPKPGTVKKPPGSGRVKGQPNKATIEIKELARKHGPDVIAGLVGIFKTSENETARIAAGKELLDRAYGKSTQPIAGDDDMAPVRAALTVGFVGGSGAKS